MASSPSSVPEAEASSPDVFLSYSRRDTERVRALVERLREAGLSVWIDETGIDLATRWSQEIVEGIAGARVFLLAATEHSLASTNVARELSLASEEKKPLFPVYLEACEAPASVRYQLAGVQRLKLYGEGEEAAFERLVRALREATGKAATARAAPREEPRRPTRRWLLPALAVGALAVALLARAFLGEGAGTAAAAGAFRGSLFVRLKPEFASIGGVRVRVSRVGPEAATVAPVVVRPPRGTDSVLFAGADYRDDLVERVPRAAGRKVHAEAALPFPEGARVRIEVVGRDGASDVTYEAAECMLVTPEGDPAVILAPDLRETGGG